MTGGTGAVFATQARANLGLREKGNFNEKSKILNVRQRKNLGLGAVARSLTRGNKPQKSDAVAVAC
jgi:hypothetical protein